MKKHLVFALLTILFIAGGSYLSLRSYKYSTRYYKAKFEYAELLNFQDRLLDGKEISAQLFDLLNGKLSSKIRKYTGLIKEFIPQLNAWETKRSKAAKKRKEANGYNDIAKTAGIYFALSAIGYALLCVIAFRKTQYKYAIVSLSLLTIASVCLITGIFTPFLELNAYKTNLSIPVFEVFNIVFEKEMYFYYTNKSVMGIIGILWNDANYTVAIAIILFSIAIPGLKIILSILSVTTSVRNSRRISGFIGKIGKWSMADVFVAAAFLAYLSFNNMNPGIEVESNALVGIYFFLGYCILSIASGHFVEKAHKESKKRENDLDPNAENYV